MCASPRGDRRSGRSVRYQPLRDSRWRPSAPMVLCRGSARPDGDLFDRERLCSLTLSTDLALLPRYIGLNGHLMAPWLWWSVAPLVDAVIGPLGRKTAVRIGNVSAQRDKRPIAELRPIQQRRIRQARHWSLRSTGSPGNFPTCRPAWAPSSGCGSSCPPNPSHSAGHYCGRAHRHPVRQPELAYTEGTFALESIRLRIEAGTTPFLSYQPVRCAAPAADAAA